MADTDSEYKVMWLQIRRPPLEVRKVMQRRKAALRLQLQEASEALASAREARLRQEIEEETHIAAWRTFYALECELARLQVHINIGRNIWSAADVYYNIHPITCPRRHALKEKAERLLGRGVQAKWSGAANCTECGARFAAPRNWLDGTDRPVDPNVVRCWYDYCCCPRCGTPRMEVVATDEE